MYLQNLKNLKVARQLSDADIAKHAGISRAAVHKWFVTKAPEHWVNVETRTLIKLAEALKISPAYFLQPRSELALYQTEFLWDRLYPNMETFALALKEHQLPALARLTQILGFYEAKLVVGIVAVSQFQHYKKFIKPIRRQQLEVLWPLYHSKTSKH